MKIGFIGQGWIGNSYSNNFEQRGYELVRYGIEEQYIHNKEELNTCDIVFIAVPTPTKNREFDGSILREVMSFLPEGTIVVIKSTIAPGHTNELQEVYPGLIVLHSPEFLSVNTAQYDADYPERNIVGIPEHKINDARYKEAAEKVMEMLPKAPFNLICSSNEAELIKYSHNISGVFQIMLYNILYDIATEHNSDWETLRNAFEHNSFMAHQYANPVHKNGRGAGGGCFIKDFAAFLDTYEKKVSHDPEGIALLRAIEKKNLHLLRSTGKDSEVLKSVYGEEE